MPITMPVVALAMWIVLAIVLGAVIGINLSAKIFRVGTASYEAAVREREEAKRLLAEALEAQSKSLEEHEAALVARSESVEDYRAAKTALDEAVAVRQEAEIARQEAVDYHEKTLALVNNVSANS